MKLKSVLPLALVALIAIGLAIPGCDELITESTYVELEDSTLGQDCNRCHGDDINKYQRPKSQWLNSRHSSDLLIDGEVLLMGEYAKPATCGPQCHTHEGFVDFVDNGSTAAQTNTNVIGCFTCHTPHSGEYGTWDDEPLRGAADFLFLADNHVFSEGDNNQCAYCHQATEAAPQSDITTYPTYDWGPHFSPQADVFAGENGWLFDETVARSNFHDAANGGCINCHFGTGKGYSLGEHSFRLTNPSTGEIHLTNCEVSGCHAAGLDSLYQYDDYADIPVLADSLRWLLSTWHVLDDSDPEGRTFVPGVELEGRQARALYNYLMYEYDGSGGIHNLPYTHALLKGAVEAWDSVPPVAEFVQSDTEICSGNTITFTSTSVSMTEIHDWYWDFGDDIEGSFGPEVTHNYELSGEYDVMLVVTSSDSTVDTVSIDNAVSVTGPEADISWEYVDGDSLAPVTVQFVADSRCIDSSTTWTWNFGDGTESDQADSVTHTFDTVGTYNVFLVLDNGLDQSSSSVSVAALGPQPRFSAKFHYGHAVFDAVFYDSSEPADLIKEWVFDYGDGSDPDTFTTQPDSVIHSYAYPGVFDVTLTVTGEYVHGSDTAETQVSTTQTGFINVHYPTARFDVDTTGGCAALDVTFTNTSLGMINIDSARWRMEYYDLKDSTMVVVDTGETPETTWVLDSLHLLVWDEFTFAAPFEDFVYQFDTALDFSVRLTVYSEFDGLIFAHSRVRDNLVRVGGPIADFEIGNDEICLGSPVEFAWDGEALGSCGDASHFWEFGDEATSNEEAPAHAFSTLDSFWVVHTATTQYGEDVDSQLVVVPGPNAEFEYVDSVFVVCPGDSLTLTANTVCPVDSFQWSFDGGESLFDTVTTEPSLTYAWPDGGTREISLTVWDGEGNEATWTSPDKGRIVAPNATFDIITAMPACTLAVVEFIDTASYSCPPDSVAWYFGDGESYAYGWEDRPDTITHAYAAAGDYEVRQVYYSPDIGDSTDYTDSVFITDEGPTAGFEFVVDSTESFLIYVTCTDTSTGDYYSTRYWNVLDSTGATVYEKTGTTSTFEYTHNTLTLGEGTFTFRLHIDGDCGSDEAEVDVVFEQDSGAPPSTIREQRITRR